MEITWEVGLKESAEELVKRKKDEKERKELTPWESYQNERKRKRKMKQQIKQKDERLVKVCDFFESHKNYSCSARFMTNFWSRFYGPRVLIKNSFGSCRLAIALISL